MNYIVVFNGGAYGNFVGWSIDWLTGKVPKHNRPWGENGNAHNNKLVHHSIADACNTKKSGIVHPINNSKASLVAVLMQLQEAFDKVIFLYPTLENFCWNINNKFEKVFPQGWLQANLNDFSSGSKFWNNSLQNLQAWEIREWLSFYIFKQHLDEVRLHELDQIDDRILKISLTELRDKTNLVFERICNFLELEIVRSSDEVDSLVNEWKKLQVHKDKDQLINQLVNAIINDENIEFDKNLTIIDQAEIQRKLREDHSIEIKCYGLNTWPKDVNELKKLLIRKNINETALQ